MELMVHKEDSFVELKVLDRAAIYQKFLALSVIEREESWLHSHC